MPEGPSILILKEAVSSYTGKTIVEVGGNTRVQLPPLQGRRITAFKSWGKHFLICIGDVSIRIHFMLFGSYSIGEQTKAYPRLVLKFRSGALYFYACSVKVLEGDLDDLYDWRADVLSDAWNAASARKKLKATPKAWVCDALLDQNIFAGVGNIIKNEVLYRIGVDPGSRVGKLPPQKLTQLIREARNYSFDFLEWKKKFELRKHWLVYTKKACPDGSPVTRVPKMGKTGRRTFYCKKCQKLYK